jgi:tetratricopeptide (TPR) repeat protein
MSKHTKKRLFTRIIPLIVCLIAFACDDVKCKGMSGSSLRQYGPEERIEKINKELASLEKNPKDEKAITRLGDLHEQLATIYLDKEEFDTALLHINKAFSYKRNNPYLNYMAGLIYGHWATKSNSKDDIAKAENYYRQAIALKKDYTDALHALAMLLFFSKKERQEPIKIIEGIYEQFPSNYRVRFTLGRFYYESGRKQDALDIYTALRLDLEKLPDSPIKQEFLTNCINNIKKVQAELGTSQ